MTAAEQSLSHHVQGPTQMEGPSHKLIISPGSRKLLVFFSGTSKSNGRFDFWSSATAQSENVLLINNGRNEWYQRGVPEFSSSIEDTAKKIHNWAKVLNCNEIITLGVSMGGYAAILFGSALNARVFALGFDSVLKYPLSRSGDRISKGTPVIHEKLRPLIEKSKCKITAITGDMDPSDLMSLSRISDLHNVKSITLRGVNHSVGRHINKFYGLADVIKAFVDNDALPEFSEIGTLACNKVRTKKIFQANQQYLIEDYEGALSFAMEVLEEDPMSEPANFVAGMAEIGLKRYTAASRHLAVTCALVPHFNTAQFHLAKALRLSGRLEQAAQHFTKYISVMPNSVGARRNLSSIYKALGNQKASAEWTARADEVDAKNKEAEALKRSMSAAKKS